MNALAETLAKLPLPLLGMCSLGGCVWAFHPQDPLHTPHCQINYSFTHTHRSGKEMFIR